MGNCCIKEKSQEVNVEKNGKVKSGITVLTFAGPDVLEFYRPENPPTFADPDVFTDGVKSIITHSVDFDESK